MIKMSRVFAMPNKNTFAIKPIQNLINEYFDSSKVWIDPYARSNQYKCITNDLNPIFDTDYHLESLDFINLFEDLSLDGAFFDPPYSYRQIKECYQNVGKSLYQKDTQTFYSLRKKAISQKINIGGFVISFGWDSNGIGKCNNFEIVEILLVNHGGHHHDTICTVERKISHQLKLF